MTYITDKNEHQGCSIPCKLGNQDKYNVAATIGLTKRKVNNSWFTTNRCRASKFDMEHSDTNYYIWYMACINPKGKKIFRDIKFIETDIGLLKTILP